MKRIGYIVSITTATVVLAAAGLAWRNLAKKDQESVLKCTTAKPYPIPGREAELLRHDLIRDRLTKQHPEVILFGDSLTQRWESDGKQVWSDRISSFNVGNAGVDNDRTENLLWRIGQGPEGPELSPRTCIVLIGINNLGADGDTPAGISAGVESVAKRLLEKFPKTRVIILGLLPSGPHSRGVFGRRARTNRKLSAIHLPGTHFHDISQPFLNDRGGLDKTLSTDGIHLSEAGYQILAGQLVPILEAYGHTSR